MAVVLWSAPVDLPNIAGTALNGLGVGNTAVLGDIDNTVARQIQVMFRIALGSINPTGAPSLTIRLFRKVAGVGPDRSATFFSGESFPIPMLTGAGARVYDTVVMRLPGPFVLGVEIINNANVALAASGNSVIPTVWSEDV